MKIHIICIRIWQKVTGEWAFNIETLFWYKWFLWGCERSYPKYSLIRVVQTISASIGNKKIKDIKINSWFSLNTKYETEPRKYEPESPWKNLICIIFNKKYKKTIPSILMNITLEDRFSDFKKKNSC